MLGVVLLLTGGTPASAAPHDCESASFCVWSGSAFQGVKRTYGGLISGCHELPFPARSAANTYGPIGWFSASLFSGSGCTGQRYPVPRSTDHPALPFPALSAYFAV